MEDAQVRHPPRIPAGRLLTGLAVALALVAVADRIVPPPAPSAPRFSVDGAWLRADQNRGIVPVAGTFVATYPDGTRVTMTQTDRGRATPPADGPAVALHGGSFAYGLGLPDEQSLGWLLQERLPGHEVQSCATPGGSPLNAWLSDEEAPVHVLAYAAFQDERVTLNRNWRRSLARDWLLPRVRTRRGAPTVDRAPTALALPDTRSPLRLRADLVRDVLDEQWVRSHGVARNLILQTARRVEDAGGRYLLVGLSNDVWTARNLRWCRGRGVEVLDLGLPWAKPEWVQPHDPTHPGAAAVRYWADGIAAALADGTP